MNTKSKILFGVAAVFAVLSPLIFVVLLVFSQSESYCFFWPGIDTRYAAGFSESRFSQVRMGMTMEIVRQKLGSPINWHSEGPGKLRWSYTADGKCRGLADFAWLGREIIFKDGKVAQVVKHVYYD